jgi:hypothetical protein
MQEETLYSDKETLVTPTRFVVGKTTYAIGRSMPRGRSSPC